MDDLAMKIRLAFCSRTSVTAGGGQATEWSAAFSIAAPWLSRGALGAILMLLRF
jgi:hypothetical protein